uniref:Protein kinase domain-containing protein n=1 Tax=Zea mays TaxID=4577 RepID=A0A804QAX2_MAIZE
MEAVELPLPAKVEFGKPRENILDGIVVFTLLFGSELFEDYISHLAMATMASSKLTSDKDNPKKLQDRLKDPHVVRLLDLKQGVNKEGQTILYLIFEYMDTDLKKFIRGYHASHEKIPAQTVKILMYQLCKGVSFVHGRGVLHRDLKPHNLLMDRKTMALKIADLGLSRAITVPVKKYTHEILTLWYRAPEVLLGATHYSTPVDIWSVGCIFAELVTNQPLFPGDSELQQLLHIFKLLGTPNEEMWPGVGKLPNWHVYPQWKPTKLSTLVPGLDSDGYGLLEVSEKLTNILFFKSDDFCFDKKQAVVNWIEGRRKSCLWAVTSEEAVKKVPNLYEQSVAELAGLAIVGVIRHNRGLLRHGPVQF